MDTSFARIARTPRGDDVTRTGRTLAPLIACLSLAACAGTPATPAAVAPPVTAAAAAPAAAPSSGTQPSADEKLASLQAWARTSGYRPYTKDGKPVWCKNEAQLGSHLNRVRCVSEDALADVQRQSLDSQQSLSRSERICAGGNCNNTR